jgi:Flp pilus assembly protein CpaB
VLAAGDPAAFTLTVGAEHALGGALAPGDRISVLATFATASGGALTRVLARGLLVLAVGAPPDIGDPSEETVPVTVALTDPAIAAGLALANTVAHVDLLRDGAGTADVSIPAATAPGVGV